MFIYLACNPPVLELLAPSEAPALLASDPVQLGQESHLGTVTVLQSGASLQ